MSEPIPSLKEDVGAAVRRISFLDWFMLLLAIASILLLVLEAWGHVSEQTSEMIVTADYIICAMFAAEFIWRWRKAGWTRGYVLRNWYEVLGMIPIQNPVLRGFRLFRVVRIVILLARFGMAADRAFGDEFTHRFIMRIQHRIVSSFSGVVTMAVLDEVAEVLVRGQYSKNVARALADNEEQIEAMMTEKIAMDPQTGRFRKLPFYDEIVRAVIQTGYRVVMQMLADPRTDRIIADVLRENITQIRESVRYNDEARHPSHRAAPQPPPPPQV